MRGLAARDCERIYTRQMPGGGFVAIETTPIRKGLGRRRYLGEILLERRADRARRVGHEPPRLARAEAASHAGLFHELFPIAHSNSALAARCLESGAAEAHRGEQLAKVN